MTINRIFTAIIAAGPLLTASATTDTLRLSLDDCIAIALSESPTIKVADMEITRMDYSRKETLGQLLPSISFGASYNRTLAKQTMYMNMDGFGDLGGDTENPESKASASRAGSDGGIKVGLDNSYSMGFNLSMPLIAPQLWKSLDLSESRILQSVEQARQSRISLVNQIKNAYYTLLLAEAGQTPAADSDGCRRLAAHSRRDNARRI